MAFIEGVGDEVTLLFALVLLFSVVVLAWISTHTSERIGTHWSSPSPDVEEESGASPSPDAPPTPENSHSSPEASIDNCSSSSNVATNSTERETYLATSSDGPQEPPLGSDPASTETLGNEPPILRHRGPGAPREDDSTESGERISVRLKFLNDTERVVTVRLSDTILHIKRTQFPGQEGHVRLIFQGQLLRDDSQSVSSLQLTDGCVVHCHISQHAPSPGHGSTELPEGPLNIGSLMVPLLVLIMALLWYCQFQYPQIFTATATVCLGAITLLVMVITFATYRR